MSGFISRFQQRVREVIMRIRRKFGSIIVCRWINFSLTFESPAHVHHVITPPHTWENVYRLMYKSTQRNDISSDGTTSGSMVEAVWKVRHSTLH